MIYAIFESDWLTEWWDSVVGGDTYTVAVIDHSFYLSYRPTEPVRVHFIATDIVENKCVLERLPDGQFQIIDRTENIEEHVTKTRRRLIDSSLRLFEKGTRRFMRDTAEWEMSQLVYDSKIQRNGVGWINFDGYEIFYSSAVYFRGDYDRLVVDSVCKKVVS